MLDSEPSFLSSRDFAIDSVPIQCSLLQLMVFSVKPLLQQSKSFPFSADRELL